MYDVIIIGAGASGLMAAAAAASKGARVALLEHKDDIGKKILATGNGRCNFSNLARPDDAYRGEHPEFVEDALREFSVENTFKQERLSLSEKQSGAECCRCTVYGGCQSGCENKDKRTGYRNKNRDKWKEFPNPDKRMAL